MYLTKIYGHTTIKFVKGEDNLNIWEQYGFIPNHDNEYKEKQCRRSDKNKIQHNCLNYETNTKIKQIITYTTLVHKISYTQNKLHTSTQLFTIKPVLAVFTVHKTLNQSLL